MPAGSGATPWRSRGPCLGCARLEPRWPRVMVMVIPFPSRPVPSSSMQTWAIEREIDLHAQVLQLCLLLGLGPQPPSVVGGDYILHD